jgi:hypothetical protein
VNDQQAAALQNWADMSGGEIVLAKTLRVGDVVVGRVADFRHTVALTRWDWPRGVIEVCWKGYEHGPASLYRPDDSLVVIRGD